MDYWKLLTEGPLHASEEAAAADLRNDSKSRLVRCILMFARTNTSLTRQQCLTLQVRTRFVSSSQGGMIEEACGSSGHLRKYHLVPRLSTK